MQYTMDITIRDSEIDYTINPFLPFASNRFLDDKSLRYVVKREFIQDDGGWTIFLNNIQANANKVDAERSWQILGTHNIGRNLDSDSAVDFWPALESLYGASGDDSLWFASIDEVYEYLFMTNYTVVVKSINGNNINYKLFVPASSNFWFRDLSVLLSGISNLDGVSATSSDNCKGMSYNINDNKLLINLDFNTNLEAKAEKYVSKFETSLSDSDYDDAQYFVQ